MKILVNCYACSPYKGSEPGMGWNFLSSLAKHHELHIITESNFKEHLDKYFEENPEEKKYYRFYFINRERHKKLRKIWPPSYYWFYKKWQKEAYQLALELHKKENFDVVHQLNMVGYREPGYLWKINDVPFVWGPIGGFNITPWNMLPSMGLYGLVFYGCRNTINLWQMHTMRRVKKAMLRADAIISATQDCKDAIKKLYNKSSTIISEVGLIKQEEVIATVRKATEPLRICWSGQHTPGKSLNLLIEAIAKIDTTNIELHVIGKGRETSKWQEKARKLGVENIIWHGWVERSKAITIMKDSHAFIITSMCDLTSTVILEALSFGLPVVTMDHCGFSNVINESCGIKIPVTNKSQITDELGNAIIKIEKDEEYRKQLSKGAILRAKDFAWEEKAMTLDNIYKQIAKK